MTASTGYQGTGRIRPFFARLAHGVRLRNRTFRRTLAWFWNEVLRGHGEKEAPTDTVLRLSLQYFLVFLAALALVNGLALAFIAAGTFAVWLYGPDLFSSARARKRGVPSPSQEKKNRGGS
jgi:hypothetical protein